MPDCNTEFLTFPSFDRRKIEASFSGGDVSSDGGVMVLRATDHRLGLIRALDAGISDPGVPEFINHPQVDLLRQRRLQRRFTSIFDPKRPPPTKRDAISDSTPGWNFALDGLPGFDLNGKMTGIIGTGKIGTVVAQILTRIGCRVLATDPLPNENCRSLGVEYTVLDQPQT